MASHSCQYSSADMQYLALFKFPLQLLHCAQVCQTSLDLCLQASPELMHLLKDINSQTALMLGTDQDLLRHCCLLHEYTLKASLEAAPNFKTVTIILSTVTIEAAQAAC